jgi:hypothetical protein
MYNAEVGSCGVKKIKLSLRQTVDVYRVETSRIPHFLDNQLTDGSEIVSLMYL